MPTVTFRGREIECETGAVLRDVLREAGVSPHNGRADLLNCRGLGSYHLPRRERRGLSVDSRSIHYTVEGV